MHWCRLVEQLCFKISDTQTCIAAGCLRCGKKTKPIIIHPRHKSLQSKAYLATRRKSKYTVQQGEVEKVEPHSIPDSTRIRFRRCGTTTRMLSIGGSNILARFGAQNPVTSSDLPGRYRRIVAERPCFSSRLTPVDCAGLPDEYQPRL